MNNMKLTLWLILVFGLLIEVSAQSGRTRPRETETAPPSQTVIADPPQKSQTANEIASDDDVLKVETALVTIPVSVLDRTGRFVQGLRQPNFKIFEDGKEQQIGYFAQSDQPLTVILLLDTSPSAELRIQEIQNAAVSFVNQLKPNDKVLVIEFDHKVNVLSDITADRAKLQKAIRKADFGDGTSLYDAVENILLKRIPKIAGRKAIVMFTDGVDTTSYKADDASSIEDAERAETPVYTVYYDTLKDKKKPLDDDPLDEMAQRGTTPEEYQIGRKYLQTLTGKTGGRMYPATTAANLETAFAEIADELRQQYSIGYYPSETGKPGTRKTVRVEVNTPDATVRARDSYVVGEQTAANKK